MSIRLAVAIAFLTGIVVAVEAAATITVGQHGMVFTQSSASLAKGLRVLPEPAIAVAGAKQRHKANRMSPASRVVMAFPVVVETDVVKDGRDCCGAVQ